MLYYFQLAAELFPVRKGASRFPEDSPSYQALKGLISSPSSTKSEWVNCISTLYLGLQ